MLLLHLWLLGRIFKSFILSLLSFCTPFPHYTDGVRGHGRKMEQRPRPPGTLGQSIHSSSRTGRTPLHTHCVFEGYCTRVHTSTLIVKEYICLYGAPQLHAVYTALAVLYCGVIVSVLQYSQALLCLGVIFVYPMGVSALPSWYYLMVRSNFFRNTLDREYR